MKWFYQLILALLLVPGLSAQSLTEIEYFFDTDPGVGNGPSGITVPVDTFNGGASLSTIGLTPGFHTLNYRVRDTNEVWSLYQKRSFFIADSSQNPTPKGITRLEYFFDTDPGVGSGLGANFSTPLDSLDGGASLVTSSLSPGFHTLNYRIKDADGIYSQYQKRSFYIQDTTTLDAEPIVEVDYWLDGGPGVSNVGLASGVANLDTVVQTAGLSFAMTPGFHTLSVQAIDQQFAPGLYQTRSFFVSDTTETGPAPPLTGVEYFVNTDPGVGNGIYLPISPTDSLDSLFVLPTPGGLGLGWHDLGMRVQDAKGNWSFVGIDSFQIASTCSIPAPTIQVSGNTTLCTGDSVQLSVPPVYASYSWSNGATTASIWVQDSGNYALTVLDTAGCAGITASIPVSLIPDPNPVILVNGQANEFCVGDSISIITDGIHDTYLWSNGDTTSFIFVNQTGSYFVTVSEEGCFADSEPVSVFAYQPPTPTVEQITPDSLRSDLVASSYIWYFNATVLPFTSRAIKVTQSGIYQVQLLDEIECGSDKSSFFTYTATGITTLPGGGLLRVYPNPGNGVFGVEIEGAKLDHTAIRLTDAGGREIRSGTFDLRTGSTSLEIDITAHPAGLYYLQVKTPAGSIGIPLHKE